MWVYFCLRRSTLLLPVSRTSLVTAADDSATKVTVKSCPLTTNDVGDVAASSLFFGPSPCCIISLLPSRLTVNVVSELNCYTPT